MVVCAITAVLAAEGKRIDLFGAMVLAPVTVVGGTFTASKAESEARDLINAGQVAGGLFLATGGTFSFVNPVGTSLEVTPLQAAPPSDLPVKQAATSSLPPR